MSADDSETKTSGKYHVDVSGGQRKYGGPPPGYEGPTPGPGHEVYCGKLPKDVMEDELIPLFEKCGTIWDLRVMMDPQSGQGRGFCFVTFTSKAEAERAVKQVDGHVIRPGKKIKANISIPNSRLFVGNIPKSKSKDEIFHEFSKVTECLTDVIIYSVPDDPKKKNRGFAFLDYDLHKSAAAAKKRLQSGRYRVFNCDIIVDWADPQKEPDDETMSKVKVLYVRNLKSDINEEMLRSAFEVYGKVDKVKKIKDYGFVHFAERDDAVGALEALNETKLSDSIMLVSLAKPPTDTKVKEERKLQHMMLLGRSFDGYWGGGAGRGGRGVRPPVIPWNNNYRTAAYDDYYGYNAYGGDSYGADDYDYYGYSGGYEDYGYGSYDDYDYYADYYTPTSYGRSRGARGLPVSIPAVRGRGSLAYRGTRGFMGGQSGLGYPRGGGLGAQRRPFRRGIDASIRGASSARGIKRKAAADFNNISETKKPHTLQAAAAADNWGTHPIAQQPLGQSTGGYNETEWYEDTYSGIGGQHWS